MKADDFLDAIVADPSSYRTHWEILADWLEERGSPEGRLIRLTSMLTGAIEIVGRDNLEAEVRELLFEEGVKPLLPIRNSPFGIEFALIPPGEFRMGSPLSDPDRDKDEGPVDVQITRPFWVAQFPLTDSQWAALCSTCGMNDAIVRHGDRAANNIAWGDVARVCKAASEQEFPNGGFKYRLLTEAEWEYACRAGSTTPTIFGESMRRDQAKLRNWISSQHCWKVPRKRVWTT